MIRSIPKKGYKNKNKNCALRSEYDINPFNRATVEECIPNGKSYANAYCTLN
jgi:hypothetical protein